jgi:hypothetical protein
MYQILNGSMIDFSHTGIIECVQGFTQGQAPEKQHPKSKAITFVKIDFERFLFLEHAVNLFRCIIE